MASSAYPPDLLTRRFSAFTLWLPDFSLESPPNLILGTFGPDPSNPKSGTFTQLVNAPLSPASSSHPDLWALDPTTLKPSLPDGVYYYWFQLTDTSPERFGLMYLTDPLAFTVDYRVTRQSGEQIQPASVIKYRAGQLVPCDLDGTEPKSVSVLDQAKLAGNNHLVVYELPCSWAKSGTDGRGMDVDVGTFADVRALFDASAPGASFASVSSINTGAILADLGLNALELCPVADAKPTDEWGYATAHYFAPDYDLGSASDLAALIETLHASGIRFIADTVMAFGHDPYGYGDFPAFHLRPTLEPNNPDAYQSHASGILRDGYGGQSWRYIKSVSGYDPESGSTSDSQVHPSWVFHRMHLSRWMDDFGLSGLRLDSVNNIGNYDFVKSYRDRAWELYSARYASQPDGADRSKFLVVGEELSMPVSGMVGSGILDALWNEPWQGRLRASLLGESFGSDTFEYTIRKLACCLDDGPPYLDGKFTDGAQVVNYITSHDVEGYRKERLYNFLTEKGVWDVEKRAKLAFVLLLTSVGIPMIFAGEEFCDQMDNTIESGKKQSDPVNWERREDGWRAALVAYVTNLVTFRKYCPALGNNDTDFFHVDESRGGKILAWRRGELGAGKSPVILVANFTDDDTPGTEYVVPNWPEHKRDGWREITQQRDVPAEWVGREPLMAWEAKVYTCWRG
jgi:pullulanase